MSNKSKLIAATAIAGLTTAIAVLGLGSQAFAKGQPTPEKWQAQTYSVANGGNFHLNSYCQQAMALTTPAFSVGGSGGLGHIGERFNSPVNSAPPPVINNPAPVFNPSESSTVPESRETPVSPASPGSVFGNG
jgi:hypothetical protein